MEEFDNTTNQQSASAELFTTEKPAATKEQAPETRPAPTAAQAEAKRQHRLKIMRIALVAIGCVVAITLIGTCVAFGIYRYSAYDDATDIVGVWYVKDTDTPITITDTTIVLTDDVAYKYTLDTGNKTITFNIGNLNGGGHYRFSIDRNELAIIDGDIDSWTSLTQDFYWTINALREQIFSGENALPANKTDNNTTLLSKTSASTQAAIAAAQASAQAAVQSAN